VWESAEMVVWSSARSTEGRGDLLANLGSAVVELRRLRDDADRMGGYNGIFVISSSRVLLHCVKSLLSL
jgi:hypothetical protein